MVHIIWLKHYYLFVVYHITKKHYGRIGLVHMQRSVFDLPYTNIIGSLEVFHVNNSFDAVVLRFWNFYFFKHYRPYFERCSLFSFRGGVLLHHIREKDILCPSYNDWVIDYLRKIMVWLFMTIKLLIFDFNKLKRTYRNYYWSEEKMLER